jgi:hypothetical protein
MSNLAAKLSVSIPHDLAKTVKKRVGAGGLSSFVARAMRHELEREQLGAYLHELDEAFGPVPTTTLAEARALWHKR